MILATVHQHRPRTRALMHRHRLDILPLYNHRRLWRGRLWGRGRRHASSSTASAAVRRVIDVDEDGEALRHNGDDCRPREMGNDDGLLLPFKALAV